jgi:hypothetical protein
MRVETPIIFPYAFIKPQQPEEDPFEVETCSACYILVNK